MLLGLATFGGVRNLAQAVGPWGWYCGNDLSAAARTQGPAEQRCTASWPAQEQHVFPCSLLACLVDGTLRIHLGEVNFFSKENFQHVKDVQDARAEHSQLPPCWTSKPRASLCIEMPGAVPSFLPATHTFIQGPGDLHTLGPEQHLWKKSCPTSQWGVHSFQIPRALGTPDVSTTRVWASLISVSVPR